MWADFITWWRLASSVSKQTYTGVWSIGPIKCVHRGDAFERLRGEAKLCRVRSGCETKVPWPVFTPVWHSQNKNIQRRNCAAEIICAPHAASTKHKIIVVWWDDDKPRVPGLSRHRVIQGLTPGWYFTGDLSLQNLRPLGGAVSSAPPSDVRVLPRLLPWLSTPWGCCHPSSLSLSQLVCCHLRNKLGRRSCVGN